VLPRPKAKERFPEEEENLESKRGQAERDKVLLAIRNGVTGGLLMAQLAKKTILFQLIEK